MGSEGREKSIIYYHRLCKRSLYFCENLYLLLTLNRRFSCITLFMNMFTPKCIPNV